MKNTYTATLDYLYSQLPMYQRQGQSAFKKNLDNIWALCAALGNPQEQFPSIHIAGTNGKGSTAHLLSAVLQAHGYQTGMYTSPHYRDFRERIKVDGELIPQKVVIRFVEEHRDLFDKIQPSFFEITVALAFQHFAAQKVEIAVVETGLGGRLDSTNIISPLLSIITNISWDHQNMLGDTLPLIAGEKAGIIKPGVPVVVGEYQEEVAEVFRQKAKQEKAALSFASQHYQVEEMGHSGISHSLYRIWREGEIFLDEVEVNLRGPFQRHNLATLFAAIEALGNQESFHWEEAKIRHALAHLRELTRYQGRWQVLAAQPLTITDSAHNEGGLKIVLEELSILPKQQLHIVLGVVKDKDLAKILPLFPSEARYYFARPNIPRGMEATDLKATAAKFALRGRSYLSVANAWRAARRAAGEEDLIFIGGSTFVVAEVV